MPTTSYEEALKELLNKDQWVEGSRRQVLGQCKKELSDPSAGRTMASLVVSGDWRSWLVHVVRRVPMYGRMVVYMRSPNLLIRIIHLLEGCVLLC